MAPGANPEHQPHPAGSRPRVLLATSTEGWAADDDAAPLQRALGAAGVEAAPGVWDDGSVDWAAADLVVVRSVWDYALRRDEFLAWADRVGTVTRLFNPAPVLRWNTDKRYLAELHEGGLPVVPTAFVEGHGAERLDASLARVAAGAAEFVVKPTVSAGAKDTGRFPTTEREGALELLERIASGGRTSMVQPYLDSVDTLGEVGLVYFDGEFSHAFDKRPLLHPGGATAGGLFAPERITARTPTGAERDVGDRVVRWVTDRFGTLLYTRVDLLAGGDGSPAVLEVELAEPSWFLDTDPRAAARAAAAISSRLG